MPLKLADARAERALRARSIFPGEIQPARETVTLNEAGEAITLMAANTGDRPDQVGSHYQFAEANPGLDYDREAARGMRLEIPPVTAVRFEPSQRREESPGPLAAARRVFRFNMAVMERL